MRPAQWSGWPDGWGTEWGMTSVGIEDLSDVAWACLDLNASVLATMPPYLIDAAASLDAGWMDNPDPDRYASWADFAKQLFWDYQLGEVFLIATARYATGYPARFHVVDPWLVDVDWRDGPRAYSIGGRDVTADVLHVRYRTRTADARGHGPLEAGRARLVAANVLARYATGFAAAGGVPPGVLEHPDELSADQADGLREQWVTARLNALGAPAVLSGGVTWKASAVSPTDLALVELLQFNESRIATLLGVPPFLVGLPSGGDSMTYSNVSSLFDYHWRAGLRPKAEAVVSAMSAWALPRGTVLEVNRDEYVRPDPYTRGANVATPDRFGGVVPGGGAGDRTVRERRRTTRYPTGPAARGSRTRAGAARPRRNLMERAPIELRVAQVAAVDFPDRIVDLIAVPYDEWTPVEYGGRMIEESFAPGAFGAVQKRASRFQVNLDHDPARWVGRVVRLEPDDPHGLRASLQIRRGEPFEQVLMDAADGMLCGSVGFGALPADQEWQGRERRRIRKAYLDHVRVDPDPRVHRGGGDRGPHRLGAPRPRTSTRSWPNGRGRCTLRGSSRGVTPTRTRRAGVGKRAHRDGPVVHRTRRFPMSATDAMVARLEHEIEERSSFQNRLIENAQDSGRDLNDQEMELYRSAAERIGELRPSARSPAGRGQDRPRVRDPVP